MGVDLSALGPCEARFSEDSVSDTCTGAVWLERAVDPVGPELILEVDWSNDEVFRDPHIDTAAESDVSEAPIGLVVFELHLSQTDQRLAIRCKAETFVFVNGHARAEEIIVFGDADECILAEPACFGFESDPAGHVEVGVSAVPDEAVRTCAGDAAACVVRLK